MRKIARNWGFPGTRNTTYLVCKDSGWQFTPVEDGKIILQQLLEIYWKGLSKPIHFFPESSLEYCRKIATGKSERDALTAA